MPRTLRSAALVLLATLCGGFLAPSQRLATPTRLSSSSKPLPDRTEAPSLAKDLETLPEDEAAEAVDALSSSDDAQAEAPEPVVEEYADISERIKARAAQLNLKEAGPSEVFENKPERNMLQQMADVAVEETQMEKDAEAYSDGLSLFEGIKKEYDQIIWPGPQEVINTLGLVVVITAVMVFYVLGVDKFLQFALDPLFHYAAITGK